MPGEQAGVGLEMRFVDPVFLVDPLYAALVEAEIGVFDDPVGHQVGVHRAGDRGRIPVVEPRLTELPVVVQVLTDGGCGCGEGHAEGHSGKDWFEVFHKMKGRSVFDEHLGDVFAVFDRGHVFLFGEDADEIRLVVEAAGVADLRGAERRVGKQLAGLGCRRCSCAS